jgi:CRP-like cAMP-binding protein
MVIKTLVTLDRKNIEKLKQLCPTHIITSPTNLFYQGQVPIVAYLIIDGIVNLNKNKKLKSVVTAGGIIGIKELIRHTPSSVTAEAQANTTICYLDRSTVHDIIQNSDATLASFFQDLFESLAS